MIPQRQERTAAELAVIAEYHGLSGFLHQAAFDIHFFGIGDHELPVRADGIDRRKKSIHRYSPDHLGRDETGQREIIVPELPACHQNVLVVIISELTGNIGIVC